MRPAEEEQAELVVAPPSTPEAPAGAPEQFFVELAKAIRQVETTPSGSVTTHHPKRTERSSR